MLAPTLLASFQNGLIYSFVQGRVCSPADFTREPIWRGVARRLAQWHATLPIISSDTTACIRDADPEVPFSTSPSAKSQPSFEAINAITPGLPAPNVWTVMQKWVFALPVISDREKSRKEILQNELKRTASELGGTPGLGGNGVRIDPRTGKMYH